MATVVHFIEVSAQQQPLVLCRWVEYCCRQGERVQVLTESLAAAQQLDLLLWTFSELSFLPHRLVAAGASPVIEPVAITVEALPLDGFTTLACDAAPPLDFVRHFQRLLHFVVMDDAARRSSSRAFYQQAREARMDLHHVAQTANLPPRIPYGDEP